MPQIAAATLSLIGLACALRSDRPATRLGQRDGDDSSAASEAAAREAEQAWMAAYAGGDDRAFDSLFKSLAPRLIAFFMRAVADRALADDLLQTTFVRLHGARHKYRAGAPVRPWVFTIAARVRIDELRRRKRLRRTASDAELERLEAEPSAQAEGRGLDDDARVRGERVAIDSLPESQRFVIQLHRFEGLSFAQIGKVLEVSEGAARIRAFRAYAALREKLVPLVAEESS